MSSWWHTATREQRLAQIDGAIELGMTSKQCAMNCGCVYDEGSGRQGGVSVRDFAGYHGRLFRNDDDKEAAKGRKIAAWHHRRKTLSQAKDAYLAGEPVNFWGAE